MAKSSFMQRFLWAGIPAFVAILFIVAAVAYRQNFNPIPSFPHAKVTIKHAHGGSSITYDMELATSQPQQAYGLMFRRGLAPDAGMLFIWPNDQMVSMWMKNTYIPLDMLFIRHDGTIEKIIAHAVPHDLTALSSGEPVRGVIEIGGGEASRLGIETGDKVVFPAFSKAP